MVEDCRDMGNSKGSPAARRQIGILLKKLREDAGKTIADVATSGIAGDTKVWRIEKGVSLPSISDVLGLAWVYKLDSATTQRLTDMVQEIASGSGGFWEMYGDNVPQFLSLTVGMEQTANDISAFQPELIHGLLQTEPYALAANHEGDDRQRNASLRMARQREVFDRKDPFAMRFVLGAGALRRETGGPEVMADQVQHLRQLNELPNVSVRVLGWQVGMPAAINGPYTLFKFASAEEESLVYVPGLTGGRYIHKQDQLVPYQEAFDATWDQSTPIEEYAP